MRTSTASVEVSSGAGRGGRHSPAPTAPDRPGSWLEAFRAAISDGRAVSHEVSAQIQARLDQFTAEDFAASDADRGRLLDLLTPRPGLYQRLSEMSECGLLGQVFPELPAIHRRGPVDPSGRAGAGAQALQAIRRLEALLAPETSGRARFSGLLEDVAAPELLTLALLLHDPGTRREPVQSREAVRLAQPVLDRLELPSSAVEAVRFLIRYHRQMARVAFRRDAEDPVTIGRFAELVSSEELLKMLCLLTLVTLDAATPDGLTSWKQDRLWRLYAEASARLAVGPADEAAGLDEAVLAVAMAGRPDDVSEDELRNFIGSLPRTYLSVFGVDAIYSHTRAARGLSATEAHATLESRGGCWELSLVTLDRPQLFATIAGVLSSFALGVHRARVLTTTQGLALAACEFTDDEGFLGQERGATRQVHATLVAAIAGTIDLETLLRARPSGSPARRPAIGSVTVSNDAAEAATLVVIAADEGPSLLPHIGLAIGEAGCTVDLSLASLDRGQAVDVLHVTRDRRKLSEPDGQVLQQEIERVLRTAAW